MNNMKNYYFSLQKIENHSFIFLFPFYFAIISIAMVFVNGSSGEGNNPCFQINAKTLQYSPQDVINCYGGMDIASYVRGAFSLRDNGLNAFGSLGFGTWPPGFSALELFLINIEMLPLPMSLLLITYTCWSFVLYNFYLLLRGATKDRSILIAIFAPVILLFVPFVYDFYLWNGLLMSEPISTALFFIAIVYLWRLILWGEVIPVSKTLLIGLMVAFSIYIRAQFDLIFWALCVGFFVIFCVSLLIMRLGLGDIDVNGRILKLSKVIFFIFIVVQGATFPYKVYMSLKGNGLGMANVSYIFESVWKSDDQLRQNGAGFFVDGGGNSMCIVAHDKCNEFEQRRIIGESIAIKEYKSAAFSVVLFSFSDFIEFKSHYFWRAWQINSYEDPNTQKWTVIFNFILAFILLILMAFRVLFSPRQGSLEAFLLLTFFWGSTIFCWLVHFEARYLLPFKLIGVIWIIYVLCTCELFKLSADANNNLKSQ